MTLPDERSRAIKAAREFLLKLARPGKLPGKKELRHEIRYLLKHFPHDYEIEKSAEKLPTIWGPLQTEDK